MTTTMLSERGLTLIELMIAIGLSVVICCTAFAAVRMAGQCIATVTHISMNNRLLREGISAALDDLDFWTSYDDPANSDTPLRTLATGREGAAFSPLAFEGSEDRATPGSRFDTYFDQSDRKAWYYGDGSNRDPTVTADFPAISRLNHPDSITDPINNNWRDWQHRWIGAMVNLGYYTLMDYSPPNLIYVMYKDTPSNNWVYWEFFDTDDAAYKFYGSARWQYSVPRGAYEVTYGTLYGLTRNPYYTSTLGDVGRRHFWLWGYSASMELDYSGAAFCANAGQDLNVLSLKPDAWSQLQVVTKHFIVEGRPMHTGTVLLSDSLNGTRLKLFVSNTGTTLRGARRQRGLDIYP